MTLLHTLKRNTLVKVAMLIALSVSFAACTGCVGRDYDSAGTSNMTGSDGSNTTGSSNTTWGGGSSNTTVGGSTNVTSS